MVEFPQYVISKANQRHHKYIRFVIVDSTIFYETSKDGVKFLRVK